MDWNDSLRIIRKEHGLTQKELASRIQVSQALISAWELGTSKPDIDYLFKLARLYKVSLDYLLAFSPKETIPEAIKAHAICKKEDEA